MSINRVVVVGNIGRDPESKVTASGKNVCDFSIAVRGRSKDETHWFRVTCWEKTAEFVSNYLGKGRLVAVEGRLTSRKYQDKDGNNREVVEIVADNVQGLDRAKDDEEAPSKAPSKAPATEEVGDWDPFQD